MSDFFLQKIINAASKKVVAQLETPFEDDQQCLDDHMSVEEKEEEDNAHKITFDVKQVMLF